MKNAVKLREGDTVGCDICIGEIMSVTRQWVILQPIDSEDEVCLFLKDSKNSFYVPCEIVFEKAGI